MKYVARLLIRSLASLSFAMLAPCLHSQTSIPTSATLYVDPAGTSPGARGDLAKPFHTLADAVSAAVSGDTIEMRPGVYGYSATITVNKVIYLHGKGAIIQAQASNEPAKLSFQAGSDGSTVDGLTIDGARGSNTTLTGVALIDIGTSGIIIRDCHLQNYVHVGIGISGTSANVRIEDNLIENVFCGIGANAPNNVRISNNRIRNGYSNAGYSGGIKINSNGNSGGGYLISGNIITNAGEMGIEVWGGAGPQSRYAIVHNEITGATTSVACPLFGISVNGSTQVVVADNVIRGCSFIGIEVAESCSYITIGNNNVDGRNDSGNPFTSAGISISGAWCDHVLITGNTIRQASYALVHPQSCSQLEITGNQLVSATELLNVQNCQDVTISSNWLEGTSGDEGCYIFVDGLSTVAVRNISIFGNTFYNAGGGMNVGGQLIGIFPGANPITNVAIKDNIARAGAAPYFFAPSGYVHVIGTGVVNGLTVRGNEPASVPYLAGSSGFYNDPFLNRVAVPASSSATGNPGDVAWDSSYYYLYIGDGAYTHSWRRIPLSTW